VDALAAGGVAILDYKSGAHKSMDWYGEHLSHPQLLAYLARSMRTCAPWPPSMSGCATWAFMDCRRGRGVAEGEAAEAQQGMRASDVWLQSRDFWKARIEALVRDFVQGRAAVDPAPQACRYCDVAYCAASPTASYPRMRSWRWPSMIESESSAADARAREEAHRSRRSIVLQAPAGSGKTTV